MIDTLKKNRYRANFDTMKKGNRSAPRRVCVSDSCLIDDRTPPKRSSRPVFSLNLVLVVLCIEALTALITYAFFKWNADNTATQAVVEQQTLEPPATEEASAAPAESEQVSTIEINVSCPAREFSRGGCLDQVARVKQFYSQLGGDIEVNIKMFIIPSTNQPLPSDQNPFE